MRVRKLGVSGDGLKGKVVLITGAASGLGRELALSFAGEGSDLVLVDIDTEQLSETAAMTERLGARTMSRKVDVSSYEAMSELADEVLTELGRVDVLVNNAGVGVGGGLQTIPVEDIEWIIGINLMGEVYGTRAFLPQMVERKAGYVINVASLSGLVALPGHIAYTTSKFGIVGFSQSLWAEVRRHGIGVTLVCPGGMKTNIISHTRMHAENERQRKFQDRFAEILNNGMDPRDAADRVMKAVKKGRFLVLLGPEAYLMYYINRVFPMFIMRVTAAVNYLMNWKS